MIVKIDKHMDCDGYPGKGTIVINYNVDFFSNLYFQLFLFYIKMKGGSNSQCSFSPTYRDAYIPNTEEGQEVLKLLKTCFKRRLIFTIGTSVTTGMSN